MLSDVHCHLYSIENPGAVVERSVREGLGLIVSNAEEVETAKKSIELAQNYDIVRAAVGIHPEYALRLGQDSLDAVERLLDDPHVVAVGEIGLDYKFASTRAEKDRQEKFFRKQIEMAVEYDYPVIVHSRRAHRPVVEILSEYDVVADLHWFSGPMDDVLRAVDAGFYFSFGPAVLLYPAYEAVIDVVPLDRILLETDSPVRFSGEEARPWWVRKVAQKIADVKKTSIDTVIEKTWENARRFFRV